MPALAQLHRPSPPSVQEAALARSSGQHLSLYRDRNEPLSIRVMEAGHEQSLELPARAVALLLEAMAAGRLVSVLPKCTELTTVQAAAILNVSHPFLIKLLTNGALPCRWVGKHRRILMEDVVTYKNRIDREREAALDQLASDAQENEMGYPRP